jgi:hypothetical protein
MISLSFNLLWEVEQRPSSPTYTKRAFILFGKSHENEMHEQTQVPRISPLIVSNLVPSFYAYIERKTV